MIPQETAALPDHPDSGALSPQHLESDPLAESTDEPPRNRATQFVPMPAVWTVTKSETATRPSEGIMPTCSIRRGRQTAHSSTLWCAHTASIVKLNACKQLLQQPHGQCGGRKRGEPRTSKKEHQDKSLMANAPTCRLAWQGDRAVPQTATTQPLPTSFPNNLQQGRGKFAPLEIDSEDSGHDHPQPRNLSVQRLPAQVVN
jgi:hypothetical protein